jgi:hypothetical protein
MAGTPARPIRAYLRDKVALTRADGKNKSRVRQFEGGRAE